jgi:hypothetical protein
MGRPCGVGCSLDVLEGGVGAALRAVEWGEKRGAVVSEVGGG